jgi:hypothetical protein
VGKKENQHVYSLQANDVKEVFDNTTAVMKGTMGLQYSQVQSSNMDVFLYLYEEVEI